MKKIANLLVCAFLAMISLASCRNEEVPGYSISVDPAELSFGYEGGKQTVEVTSSHKWTLTNDSDWITTSVDKGESGSLVEISADHNISADIKSGEIIFTCGDKTAVLKVSQEIDGDRTIQFKDPNFLKALIAENVDADGDGQITVNEAKAVKSLNVSDSDIKEMSEIRYFTALVWLYCYGNQLTTLDVSNNTALTELHCYWNQLTDLDVSKNTALTQLYCDDNQLTTLDVSNNTDLKELHCYNNQLTTLDVSNNTALTYLWCSGNPLTTLDVSNNTALTQLYCYDNQLTALDVSNNTALENLDCEGNPLQSVTISESQINASWLDDVRQSYPEIEIIVK